MEPPKGEIIAVQVAAILVRQAKQGILKNCVAIIGRWCCRRLSIYPTRMLHDASLGKKNPPD